MGKFLERVPVDDGTVFPSGTLLPDSSVQDVMQATLLLPSVTAVPTSTSNQPLVAVPIPTITTANQTEATAVLTPMANEAEEPRLEPETPSPPVVAYKAPEASEDEFTDEGSDEVFEAPDLFTSVSLEINSRIKN